MAKNISNLSVTLQLMHGLAGTTIAMLRFDNSSEVIAALWRPIALLDGRINAERFYLKVDGQTLEYIGKTAKLGAAKAGEFEILQPGKSVEALIPLNQGYSLPTHGQLEAFYEALNPSLNSDTLTKLRSNVATIELHQN